MEIVPKNSKLLNSFLLKMKQFEFANVVIHKLFAERAMTWQTVNYREWHLSRILYGFWTELLENYCKSLDPSNSDTDRSQLPAKSGACDQYDIE